MEDKNIKKKKREFPSGLVIVTLLIFVAAILTYLVPAGEYTRLEVDGRQVVDPNSFHSIAANPASIFDLFTSIPKGFQQTAGVCFLLLIVGGVISVVTETGAIQAGLNVVIRRFRDKSVYLLPLIILLFSIPPALMGSMEVYLAYVPLGVIVARSMGLDALVGLAIIVLAGGAGLSSAITNPFNIGVAQGLAGLPTFSGITYRVVAFICFNISVSFWTMRYAKQVIKDKKNSWVYELEVKERAAMGTEEMPVLDTRRSLVMLAFLAAIGGVVYISFTGIDAMLGIPAVFLMLFIAVSIIMGYEPNEAMRKFTKGSASVVGGVLIVGFARAITILLNEAGIVDTVVNSLVKITTGKSNVFTAVMIYLVGHATNFFIISDAGAASVLMPILGPVGEISGITLQTVAHAVMFGGALGNSIMPTSPTTSGACGISGVDYRIYLKFALRVFFTNSIIAGILIAFMAATAAGPF